jgi:hypothetical protein
MMSNELADNQGVLTETIAPYVNIFLPALQRWIATDESFHDRTIRDWAIAEFRRAHIG